MVVAERAVRRRPSEALRISVIGTVADSCLPIRVWFVYQVEVDA